MLPETQLFIRAFPSPDKDWNNVKLDADLKLIYLRSLEDLRRGKSGSNIYWQFKVDDIFVNVSQEEFYQATVPKDLLQKVFKGNDLTILCFGSSNTGKSYSAFGIYNRFEYRGIGPRLLEDVFKLKDECANLYKIDISLAYVEIIGKNIHNLLEKGKPIILKSGRKTYHRSVYTETFLERSLGTKRCFTIRQTSWGGFNGRSKFVYTVEFFHQSWDDYLPGFGTRLETICQGMKLIFEGDERRNFENETSHCGTSVLTFDITATSLLPTNPITATSRIHLIDTAGTDYGNSPTKSFKCHINANLTKCELNTLCSWNGNDFDPKKTFLQRGSTLALYLGSAVTYSYSRLLGHIRTTNEDLASAMSTLLFGTRLRRLHSPLLVQAKTKNPDLIIRGLQDELREVKDNIVADKLVKNVFMPDTISQDHMDYILREIHAYCQSPTYPPSILLTKAHPLILVLGFKEIYNRDMEELKDIIEKELEVKEKAVEQENMKAKRLSLSLSSMHNRKMSPGGPAHSSQPTTTPPDTRILHEDLPKIEMESELTGEDNFARTFSEYLSKSAAIKLRIKLYEIDIEDCFKTKCELQSKLTDLKQQIELLRIELKKEEWNTFHKKLSANIFSREGKELFKSPEEEKIELEIEAQVDDFNKTRSSLYTVHNKYVTASYELNQLKTNVEKEFNEYVKLMFSSTLLLPKLEAAVEDKLMKPTDTTSKGETEDRVKEAEKCFAKLQRKPLKKSSV